MNAKWMVASAVAISVLSAVQSPAPQQQMTPFYSYSVYLSNSDFTEKNVISRCLDILKDEQVSFVSVWFFTSQEAGTEILSSKFSDRTTYDMWLPIYDRLKAIKPIARMISIGKSSVLLFRGADGAVSKRVLSGGNPLEIEFGNGRVVHLLHLVLTPRGYQSPEYRMNVYAWTKEELSEDLGLRVISELKPKLSFPEIVLHVRHDPWFIDDAFFPMFSPFDPEFLRLDKAQYVSSPILVCGTPVTIERYRCSVFDRHY